MGGAAAADASSNMSDELTTYRSQNDDMRLRNRRSGGGSLADSTSSVNGGDIVTTTHTISEMRVHERSQRGRQSEKHVVVKMAVRQKSHRHGDGDDSDDGDGGAERDMNGTNRNDGQYDNHNGSRTITVEEIDDDEEDKSTRDRAASDYSDAMNNSGSMASNSNGNLQLTDVTDATIQETMLQLVTETECMKQYFYGQEQAFRREREYVEQLKKEHKALKTMAKEYKCRAREQKRVQRILREVKKKDSQSHSRGNKRKVKKQCQQLQQYQSELALRLELVQSKNNVYEMHVEKQLAELRREYSDSYLFPNPFHQSQSFPRNKSCEFSHTTTTVRQNKPTHTHTQKKALSAQQDKRDRAAVGLRVGIPAMIWPDEEHDSSRQLQKKLEYAKELELQIELRRARQREEQLELEELERKFQPDDCSPAKWLIDGGYSAPVVQHPDFASYRSPFRFPQQQREDAASDGQQYNGQADSAPSPLPPSAGEPSGAPSVGRDGSTANGHMRFRIMDLQGQTDRLRERAQQLEWKRILDEQVRENARLKQQEEEERRRDEAGSVREEMMFLRDQQLAAQRRMGFPVGSASQQSPTYTPAVPAASPQQAQYERLDTPPDHHHHHQVSDYQQQNHYERARENDNLYGLREPQRANQFNYRHHYDADTNTMPPPAPSRFNFPSSSPQPNREPASLQTQQQQQQHQQQSYDSFADSRSLIINEYRSLLADIRREREELRQEKEELRQEKEQLRLERTLLQLENEKMANFVETQRRLNEQQLEMQQQQEVSFRQQPQPQQQQQYQQQSVSASPSPMGEYYHAPPSPVHRSQRPPAFDLSQINQMERSIAALGMGSRSVKETRAPERRPSPVSMDDFAVPQNRLAPNVVDSPRFKRLSQFRFKPTAADDGESNALDRSLIGESVFVALSPEEVSSAASRGPPRITETASPRRGEKPENSIRNELRSSRVIKSRGFYSIESEAGAFPARAAEKEAERHKSERQHPERERRKKSSAHKSPSRMHRSTEKARLQQEKPAAKAFKEYETSNKFVPFTPSSSAVDVQQQQKQQQSKHRQQQRQRQFASSAGHNGSAAAAANYNDSKDSEEPELSRSLFQVKVLV